MGSGKKIWGSAIKRLLLPHHLFKVIQLQRKRKSKERVFEDPQLKLYHDILPGDFLHYGYFDHPEVHPLDMTINMIYQAQERYGEKLAELINDKTNPALDVGCGMGGLLKILNKKNIPAIGLTPDAHQVKHLKNSYPNKIIESKFEDVQPEAYLNFFGTIITSESLQYLDLPLSIAIINKILKTGGQWIACDYFRTGASGEKSGHNWAYFIRELQKGGFKISYQEDITANIIPTIAYVHHWASKIGLPLKDFLIGKFQIKAPGFYYAFSEALPEIEKKLNKNIATVDPVVFAQNKKYILMVIERE